MDLSGDPPLYRALAATPLADWAPALAQRVRAGPGPGRHGDLTRWTGVIDRLPRLPSARVILDRPCISVEPGRPLPDGVREHIAALLQELHPWRKGPFSIHGVELDAEWRSDLKWSRLADAIAPLDGRLVLDVGCGNGYYAWRMVGAGARLVLGIDPSWRHVCQYRVLRHFLGEHPAYVLPLALEELPDGPHAFDTVFSMGVLYHRRSPFGHLLRLRDCLRPGGQLVLETLIVREAAGQVLVPEGRYAQMRNVWFIPAPDTLLSWLRRCGFRNPRLVDLTSTRVAEQRTTEWMRFQSLSDFLDPARPGLTVEGLPAPVRGIFVAEI